MFHSKDFIGVNGCIPYSAYDHFFRECKFWKDKDNNGVKQKDWCENLNQGSAYEFASKFLPAFGFFRYRQTSNADAPYLIIQKRKQVVTIIGEATAPAVQHRLLEWTVEAIDYLQGAAGVTIPKNLKEQLFIHNTHFFGKYVPYFLTVLPKVECEVEVIEDGRRNTKVMYAEVQPMKDRQGLAHMCFNNGVLVCEKESSPSLIPYSELPSHLFIWDKAQRPYSFPMDHLKDGPKGKWWNFLQDLAKVYQDGKWIVNHDMLSTLVSAYGYLIYDFYPPDQRKAVILYDRTTGFKDGGNGKSIVAKSLEFVRPSHLVDMKHEKDGNNRFLFSGYTPDKRVVILSDTSQEFNFERFYNQITDGFTVEWKNGQKYVMDPDESPKLVITTNFTINSISRSDKRRQFFVPIGTYYGTLWDSEHKTPADVHGGYLLDKHAWSDEDWGDFYATCAYCLQEYLDHGLVPFDDEVRQDQQLLKVCKGNELLLKEVKGLITSVIGNDGDLFRPKEGEISRDAVLEHLNSVPELEAIQNDANADRIFTRSFKSVATGMGILVNPGRDRYQKVVDGETQDWFRLVRPAQVKVTDDDQDAADLNPLQQHFKDAGGAA